MKAPVRPSGPKERAWETLSRVARLCRLSALTDDVGNAVLMYHSVGGPWGYPGTDGRPFPTERFRRDLAYLTDRYDVVDLDAIPGGDPPERKRVALTFDDGYRDFLTEALPILREFDVPATLFPVSGVLLGRVHPEDAFDLPTGTTPEFLSASDVEALVEEDHVTLGCHTRSHPELTAVGPERLQEEVAGAKADLEERFGTSVDRFCYPGGRHDERVRAAVREAYDLAVTVERGVVRPSGVDPVRIPRIDGGRAAPVVRWELTDSADRIRRIYGAIAD